MYSYSERSKDNLKTCHVDLQTVFNEVIKYFDCTITHGQREPNEQFKLFKKGRKKVNGVWIISEASKVVTYKDGHIKKSKHNITPLSEAVDAVPYPIDWKDTTRVRYFAGIVKGIAYELKRQGKITHDIRWGGDWSMSNGLIKNTFDDLYHFEIIT